MRQERNPGMRLARTCNEYHLLLDIHVIGTLAQHEWFIEHNKKRVAVLRNNATKETAHKWFEDYVVSHGGHVSGNLKFEIFCDTAYWGMWCVRPIGDRDFNSPRCVHFATEQDARAFKDAAEKGTWAVEPPQ